MTVKLLIVEVDENNSLTSLLESGNYFEVDTPIEDMCKFEYANIRLSVSKPEEYHNFVAALVPGELGIEVQDTHYTKA